VWVKRKNPSASARNRNLFLIAAIRIQPEIMIRTTIAIKKTSKIAIDPRANDEYVLRRDSELEHSTAGKRAAAEWRGGLVLIHTQDFRNLTAVKGGGVFCCPKPNALVETG
jgi:hypothetical protein